MNVCRRPKRLDLEPFATPSLILRQHINLGIHMSCCHNYYVATEGNEGVFSVDIASISFGHGVFQEAGEHARGLGMNRVALFTDKKLGSLPYVALVRELSLIHI